MAGRVEGTVWRGKTHLVLGVIVLLVPCTPSRLGAQFTEWRPSLERAVVVQAELPRYTDAPYDVVALRGAFVMPLRPRITLATGLSLAYAKEADLPASAVISNVFVSLQFGGEGGFGTLTLTLPTTGRLTNQAYAADAGLTMDLERPERFTPRALGIAAYANPRWRFGKGGRFGGRVGLALVSPSGLTSEIYGRYGAFIDGLLGPVRAGIEVTGAAFFGGTGGGVGEITVHHATAYAGMPYLPSSPDVFARIPLDDDGRGVLDLLVGLRLTF